MRNVLLILVVGILFTLTTLAQDNTPCLRATALMENSLYKELKIKKKSNFSEAFAAWFFSESFEKEVKSGKIKGGITIPFLGGSTPIPVTFSAEGNTDDAWEKWHLNKSASKWNLNQATFEEIYQRTADPEALDKYVRALQICTEANGGSRVSGDIKVAEESATATFYYIQKTGEAIPVILNIVSGSGFDCRSANRQWAGHQLNTDGIGIIFPWKNNSTSGSITLNTTRGSKTLTALRPVKPVSVIVRYTAIQTAVEKIQELVTAINTPDMHERGADEDRCNAEPNHCSDDKKYEAAVTPLILNVPINHQNSELRNARTTCSDIDGNTSCGGWARILTDGYYRNDVATINSGTSYRFVVKTWSRPVRWTLYAEEWGPVEHPYVVTKEIALNGRKLEFSVPKSSVGTAALVYSKHGTPMEVKVGQPLDQNDELVFQSVNDLGTELVYHYESKR